MVEVNIRKGEFGRIVVSFPYDPSVVTKIKAIEGRRWHPVEKHWSFTKLNGMLEKILKVFGDEEIYLDPALKSSTPKAKDTPSPLGGGPG
jgi:hypothetical protein